MSYIRSRYFSSLQWGKPLRPYNKLQMLGVALIAASIAWLLLWFTGRLGWTPRWIEEQWPFIVMSLVGNLLLYSRREDYVPSDEAQRHREMLRTGVVVLGVIVLSALFILNPQVR